MRHSTRRIVAAAVAAMTMSAGLAACSNDGTSADGTVTLEFFQSKSEAIEIVDELIADFEAENPGIKIEQQNAQDGLTVLMSRIAKDDIPDIIGTSNYGDVAQTGILKEQNGTAAYDAVSNDALFENMRQMAKSDKDYAVPWSMNAVVVMYNKDQFAELGLEVPQTWDEFIAVCDAIEEAGRQPLYFTWKDAWTIKTISNSLGGSTQGSDFWSKLQDGSATFSDSAAWRTAAERMLQLKEYAQEDPFGTSYDSGNTAFANGEAVMYIEGTWAIPEVYKHNPDVNIGAFALPTSDEPGGTPLVSAIDSVLGVSASTKHPEEAQKFVDFMLSDEAQKKYVDSQNLIPVVADAQTESEIAQSLKTEYVEQGKTAIPPDIMLNGSSDMAGIDQTFLQDEDIDAFLAALDEDFASHGIK